MGVVLPHQVLRPWPEVMRQPVYRVGHVVVTDVPRFALAAHHDPVVVLGVGGDLGVLRGIERLLVLGPLTGAPPHLDEQGDYVGPSGFRHQRVLRAYSCGSSR